MQRIQAVIVDGIPGTHHFNMLHARYGLHELYLYIRRQSRGHPLHIHFVGVQPFRFNEQLMAFLILETDDFRFNGRTVTGTYPLYQPVEHAGTYQIVFDDLMGHGRSIGEPAGNLLPVRNITNEGKVA